MRGEAVITLRGASRSGSGKAPDARLWRVNAWSGRKRNGGFRAKFACKLPYECSRKQLSVIFVICTDEHFSPTPSDRRKEGGKCPVPHTGVRTRSRIFGQFGALFGPQSHVPIFESPEIGMMQVNQHHASCGSNGKPRRTMKAQCAPASASRCAWRVFCSAGKSHRAGFKNQPLAHSSALCIMRIG
jgi:hypothetical protein